MEHETNTIWLPVVIIVIAVIFGIWSNLQTRASNDLLRKEISSRLRPNLVFTPLTFYEKISSGSAISPALFTEYLNTSGAAPVVRVSCTNEGLVIARNVKVGWKLSNDPTKKDEASKLAEYKNSIPSHNQWNFSAEISSITVKQPYHIGLYISFDYERETNAYYFFDYIVENNAVQLWDFDSAY